MARKRSRSKSSSRRRCKYGKVKSGSRKGRCRKIRRSTKRSRRRRSKRSYRAGYYTTDSGVRIKCDKGVVGKKSKRRCRRTRQSRVAGVEHGPTWHPPMVWEE